MRLRAALAVDLPTPIPMAILDGTILAGLDLATGTRVIVRYRGRKLAVWVRDLTEIKAPQTPPPGLSRLDTIWLSRRARDLLRVEKGDCDVIVDARARRSLRVAPALVDDLPRANEVDVAARLIAELGTRRAIAYTACGTVPILLRPREIGDDGIRMSMLTRTLIGIDRDLGPGRDHMVQIGVFQSERLFLSDRCRGRTAAVRNLTRANAALKLVLRSAIHGVESCLRLVMHAPTLSMRTVEAEIGDDTNRVVRVATETMRLLGIQPGDEVFLDWGASRVIAIAHEKLPHSGPGTFHGATADDWGSDPVADAIPDHLVIGVSAVMRGELRIPRRTIVNVRRRVLSIFAQRVNELTIPLGGLLFAALALDKISGLTAAIGAVIVTIMAMAPVRYRIAPRGRWP